MENAIDPGEETDAGRLLHDQIAQVRALGRHALKKAGEKLLKRQAELEEAGRFSWYRQMGDSLLADPVRFPRGTTKTEIVNIHSGRPETITLNAKLDAPANAKLLYKKAKKGQRGAEVCAQKVAETQQEFAALSAALNQLGELAGSEDVSVDIKEERLRQIGRSLAALGVPVEQVSSLRAPREKREEVPYRHFILDGWDIYAGKNDAQNDELTVHFARSPDIWMHVAQHQGSHVLIRRRKEQPWPPEDIMRKAAGLAVWFSKAKHTSSAEVHVTEARFVHKRHGSPAGQAIAERCKTIRTAPLSPHEIFGSDYTAAE
ncbi:MAG: NFACT RNA binding domain-containing protein [Chitinivibrionales bacterium]|nr:NFACT RNA binding domain-containing protein [Chitinivibrionales bacterium]